MKKTLAVIIACVLGWTLAAEAGSGDDALWGGLMGAAVGAIVGHHSGDIRTEVAVPAFAAVGAALGYGYDRGWYGTADFHPYDSRYRGRSGWNRQYLGHDPYWGARTRVSCPQWPERVRRVRAPDPAPPREQPRQEAPRRNLQPGVEIVRVPLQLPNGTVISTRILKVGGRYIGPQGEAYTSLPTREELAKRYLGSGGGTEEDDPQPSQ